MNINKPGDTSNSSQINLTQTPDPRDVSRAGASQSSPASAAGSQNTDSIALSNTSDLVQLALSSGVDARAARVQQLKALYDSNQYYAEPLKVSRSLIDAHLAGA